jgi:hypothetical protein
MVTKAPASPDVSSFHRSVAAIGRGLYRPLSLAYADSCLFIMATSIVPSSLLAHLFHPFFRLRSVLLLQVKAIPAIHHCSPPWSWVSRNLSHPSPTPLQIMRAWGSPPGGCAQGARSATAERRGRRAAGSRPSLGFGSRSGVVPTSSAPAARRSARFSSMFPMNPQRPTTILHSGDRVRSRLHR